MLRRSGVVMVLKANTVSVDIWVFESVLLSKSGVEMVSEAKSAMVEI